MTMAADSLHAANATPRTLEPEAPGGVVSVRAHTVQPASCPFDHAGFAARLAMVLQSGSIRDHAERAGVSRESVRRYMRGETPNLAFLTSLCTSMGINAEWLLTGHGAMYEADIVSNELQQASLNELLFALSDRLKTNL